MGLKHRSSGCFLWSIGASLFLQVTPNIMAASTNTMAAPVNADSLWRRQQTPVAWQLTRARFKGTSSITQTETFRENWTIEYQPKGICVITSPHASVRATIVTIPADSKPVISVSEIALAQLLGVAALPPYERAADGATARFVNLQFLRHDSHTADDVTLNLSDDEHVAVHFEVGT